MSDLDHMHTDLPLNKLEYKMEEMNRLKASLAVAEQQRLNGDGRSLDEVEAELRSRFNERK